MIIINKSITKETFKDLLEMYKRQGIKVTNKIVDDEFISYVVEGFQYIYTKDIKTFPVDLIYPYVPSGNKEYLKEHIDDNNQLNESVELIAKDYIKCHGKNPAGIGTWIFGIGSKKSSDWVEFKGKFSDAKKKAIKQAEEKSVSKIYVMESLSNESIDLHYDIKLNNKGYRVAIIKENNEIAVTQAITLSGAESIAKKLIHNILIDTVPKKSEFNIKEFKESVNKFKDNRIEKHTNISMQNTSKTKMNKGLQEDVGSIDPNIGRKWMGRYGTEKEIEFFKDGKYYLTIASGGEIIPANELEKIIKVDTSWYNLKLKTDKELADQEAAKIAAKQAKDERFKSIGGNALQKGRTIKALDKKVIYKGKITTIKDLIDSKISDGWIVTDDFDGFVLEDPNGEFQLTQKTLGKIGIDYAKQLLNSINEDLIQKTEQSIRTPFKVVKVDSYYMIKDNLGQYLHGEYTKEDADNLVKQLNAIGNVQFSINESVDDVNLVKQKANEALNRLKKSTSEFSQSIDFDKKFDVDDNDTPVVFRAAAAIQEIKNLGWDLIAGDSSEYSTNDSSSYLVVRKDDVTAKIRISNHSNATKLRDYPDVNIAPNEDTVWDIEDKLSIKYEEEHEIDESINESVKSFEIKYRSTSDSSKTEGSKVITAPDQNVARKRFTEDNPELKNLQIISITEVTDKI